MAIELFSRELGGAATPPLIILHGLLGSSRNWMSAGRSLADPRRVWALDLRNHGDSPHTADHSYPAMVDDVLGWMDERELQAGTFIGHSMGGKVAMRLACSHPDRVHSLVVVDIAPRNNPPYHRELFETLNAVPVAKVASREEVDVFLQERIFSLDMRRFVMSNLVRRPEGGFAWKVNLGVLTGSLEDLAKSPINESEHYFGPSLFVRGGKSDFVREVDFGPILGHFPSARIETILQAGHNPHIEQREKFVTIVESFLDSRPAVGCFSP